MTEPRWVSLDLVLAVHLAQLAEHGGREGVRDRGLLESAVARPRQRLAYEPCDLADLAASYALGLLRNHPFIDGNKRTALVTLETFLMINGTVLEVDDRDCVLTIEAAAAGDIDDHTLAIWIRTHMTLSPIPDEDR